MSYRETLALAQGYRATDMLLGIVGQSQAAGTAGTDVEVSPGGTTVFPRGSSCWHANGTSAYSLADWVVKSYGIYPKVFNFSVGSSGVSPLIAAASSWSPTLSEGLWDVNILGTSGSWAYPMAEYPVSHLEVMFGTGDGNIDPDNFADNLKAFTDGLLALWPQMKIMMHVVPSAGDWTDMDVIRTQWQSYCTAYADGVNIFAGLDCIAPLRRFTDETETGLMDVAAHPTSQGFTYFGHRMRVPWRQPGWVN